MLELVERLERMTVTATSPDGNLIARLHGKRRITFEFHDPDAFGRYSVPALEYQIAALLRGVKNGRQRAVRTAVERAGEEFADPGEPHWDADHRRYRAEVAELEALGRSRRGWIRVTAVAMNVDSVRIDSQALSILDTEGFLAELHSAYQGLLTSYRTQLSELKRKHLPM